ncbi:hypothetical protein I4U23_015449 [Adineta vaga]|nr:hypothetical protein I4U23_015449 [Adineta vaga]
MNSEDIQDVVVENEYINQEQLNNEKKTFSPNDNSTEKLLKINSLRTLFRYATSLDIVYMTTGMIASCLFGLRIPLYFLFFGNSINSFNNRLSSLCSLNFTALTEQYCPSGIKLTSTNFYESMSSCNFTESNFTNTNHDAKDEVKEQINFMIILAFLTLLFEYLRVTLFNVTAERQTILKQEIVYFDHHKTGELNALLTDNMNKIRDGIGDKFSSIISVISGVISSLILCLIIEWKLSLVVISAASLILVTPVLTTKLITKFTKNELVAYGKAGAIAEEVISSIRTVLSYNGQEKEIERYEKYLLIEKTSSIRKDLFNSLTIAVHMFFTWSSFSLGLWYGAKLVQEENSDIGSIFTVFITLVTTFFSLRYVNIDIEAFLRARTAAVNVEKIIHESAKTTYQQSDISKNTDHLIGNIHFLNVSFCYPTRSDVSILNNLSFDVKCGQTIALVGSSGSGKSTCIQLLQRFYQLNSGQIFIDEKEINEYDLKWLRQQMGVVSQEPALFHTTIRENILFGHDTATEEEIQQAAKLANAHDFIMTLPDKYETEVGELGVALSGGQKQRIAIARAVIRNPKILLLDEATSALDNESETIVQDALDRAAQGRTTLVIAHRLSTIRNADKIIVINKGQVVEEGDHESLMNAHGTYFDLVQQQSMRQYDEEKEIALEKQETNEQLLSLQSHLDEKKERSSTVISITPSILAKLYGKESPIAQNDDVHADENVKRKKEKQSNLMLDIFRMIRPEWMLFSIGCVASLIIGVIDILYGIFQIFQECDSDSRNQQIIQYVLIIIGCGIIYFIFQFLQGCMFAYCGGNLIQRLRSQTFRAILSQDLTFFDNSKHNTGALCTFIASQLLLLVPNYGKGVKAAKNIFLLIKRKATINSQLNDGDKIPNLTGQLDFDNVYFVYPTRKESIVLKKFKLTIKSGQKVALVGSSGSGKSTTIQLIERFYDPNIGQILVDSKDIRSLNLQWYRSKIGIVSQEPVLFNMSIRENIAYGDNNRKDIPLDEIIEAAKTANIHDFIQRLPDGYETLCGAKGVRLSGGQKQRIAIARALFRNPTILLLDEATSALDSENEKIVQEALERAQENRTSITIAHRLSTIQKCDVIYVMHNGMIVEYGTHEELLSHAGRYYQLVQHKLK